MAFAKIWCASFALLACASTVCGMLNGTNAEKGQFPYMASIYHPKYSHPIQGGCIVSSRYILTIAYGIDKYASKPSEVVAYVGAWKFSKDASVSQISEIKVHPDWHLQSKRNNIALVKTVDPIDFSEFVKPISLPITDFPNKDGVLGVVSGFGAWFAPQHIMETMHRSGILQFQMTKTLNLADCKKKFTEDENIMRIAKYMYKGIEEIDGEFICTASEEGKGMCLGDTGNPLVAANTLVGLSAWCVECSDEFPNVYTKVYSHMKWIQKEMKN